MHNLPLAEEIAPHIEPTAQRRRMHAKGEPRVSAIGSAAGFSPTDAQDILRNNLPRCVLDLGVRVESVLKAGGAVIRLPWSDHLARKGGTLSGAALMAAADTAAVIAVSAAYGGYTPMATVQQSTTFQRATRQNDILVEATVSKLGRRMAFVSIELREEGSEELVAHAANVFTLPG